MPPKLMIVRQHRVHLPKLGLIGERSEVRSLGPRSKARRLVLLLWREIPLARPYLRVLLQRRNLNRPEAAIRVKVRRLVGHDILAA